MNKLHSAAPSKGGSATEKLRQPRRQWTSADDDAMFAVLADGTSYRAAATHLGLSHKSIAGRVEVLRQKGDPRAAPRQPGVTARAELPDDFATKATTMSNAGLCALYGQKKNVIIKWRQQTGTSRKHGGKQPTHARPTPPAVPDNFARLAPTMRRAEARVFFGVSDGAIARWALAAGVTFRRVKTHAVRGQTVTVDHNAARDMTRAGQAADFLRRFGPVYRCSETGHPEGKPTHWRRGSCVLTDAEIVERAERNGWQPDAWKKLAA